MKILKFIPPYHPKTGKPNFPERGKTGVYLIKEDKDIVYIGYSGKDLYKTMYRHFQTWNHTGQEVVSYADRLKKGNYTVRIVYCTPKQADALEKALIKKHKPRDNGAKYESLKLLAYDRNALDVYHSTTPETVHFTAAQLKHMQKVDEEDKLEREALEEGPEAAALFGETNKWNLERLRKTKVGYDGYIIESGYSVNEKAIEALAKRLIMKGFTVSWKRAATKSKYFTAESENLDIEIRFSNHTKKFDESTLRGKYEGKDLLEYVDEFEITDKWTSNDGRNWPKCIRADIQTPLGFEKIKKVIDAELK